MTPVLMDDPNIRVFDDVLPDPMAYRAAALAQTFETHIHNTVPFHGIAMSPPDVSALIMERFPSYQPTLTFFRQSPKGQMEPNFIHCDRTMGDWTALLYLTPDPPAEDGTDFWTHRPTGDTKSTALGTESSLPEDEKIQATADWDRRTHVAGTFNRMLLFPAPYYHSRAIFDNFGDGDESRLVHVTFGEDSLWQQ
jgi:hypothetical protein